MVQRKPTDDVQLKVRMREDLRKRLEREAKKNNVSLNAEVVSRLARSFEASDRLDDILGGSHTTPFILAQAALIRSIEAQHSARWTDDPKVRAEVRDALQKVLDAIPDTPTHFSNYALFLRMISSPVEPAPPVSSPEPRPKTRGATRKER